MGKQLRKQTIFSERFSPKTSDYNFFMSSVGSSVTGEIFVTVVIIVFSDLSNNELGTLPPYIFRNITAVEFL